MIEFATVSRVGMREIRPPILFRSKHIFSLAPNPGAFSSALLHQVAA
jgi:hypothetical protein